MNKNTLIALVGLIVLGSGVYALTAQKKVTPTASGIEYCGSDGTLVASMPIQSHRSYCIKSDIATVPLTPNQPIALKFSIIDDQGNTLKDLQVMHDMLLHLIVVRKDLATFQHLHPEFDASTGVFTLFDLTFGSAGDYRIYADFTPASAQMGPDGIPLNVVLTQDVSVLGQYAPQALTPSATTKTFDGYTVTLKTDPATLTGGEMPMFSFTIKKDGKLVTDLEQYLAALGHSVIIRESTLDYIHAHAIQQPRDKQNGTIDFHVELSSGGNYKVFTQFQHDGKVITTDFVVPVTGGTAVTTQPSAPTQMSTQGTDHSMH